MPVDGADNVPNGIIISNERAGASAHDAGQAVIGKRKGEAEQSVWQASSVA